MTVSTKRQVYFALFPGCEVLDIAGPVQALHEARALGVPYAVQYVAITPTVRSAQGLEFSNLLPLPSVSAEDWVFIPGSPLDESYPSTELTPWLREVASSGARLCSVCTGAFALGEAGLLDGRQCTTHWKRIMLLQERFPRAKVIDDRLYVEDGKIVSSAGIAAGIDMTLGLLEEDAGSQIASAVAREMVVYMRRDGAQPQESIYLQYQSHLNAGIHQVQQYLINAPTSRATLEELAAIANMSARHLTRTFRRVTGISIGEFRLRLRLERAYTLMQQSTLSLETIAFECGFADARQLRRYWARYHGTPPSAHRKHKS